MGGTKLGEAMVPVRASLDELDKDLESARGKFEKALGAAGAGLAGVAGGILTGGLAAGAVLGKLAIDAAPLEGIRASFQGVADDADAMLAALRAGSSGMITDAELMKTYNSAAQLVGETFANDLPAAMGPLGKVAAATGQDMGFMLDSLVKGVGRLSPMILDNLGIQVTLADATARAAEMFGVEESALTKAQTQAGMMAVATEALAANTADMPEVAGTAAAQLQQLQVTMANLKAEVGTALLPVLQAVLTPLADLAQKYGPQLAAVFGRLAEMLGPLVGGAMEMLVPIIMQLLDALIPLAETLLAQLFPAFEVILGAVVGLAGTILATLAPVLGDLLEAILPVVTSLVEMLAPILAELIAGLLPVLAPLLVGIAEVFGRLMLAILPVVDTLLSELAPVLVELITALLPPLTEILLVLADIFLDYVEDFLPIFAQLLEMLIPVLGELAVLIAEGVAVALEGLGGILEEVGKGLEWLRDKVLKPLKDALAWIAVKLEDVVGWFKKLSSGLRGLELPGWLTPGSPTPLELGLAGIGDELRRVERLTGGLNAEMQMQAAPGGTGSTWNGNVIINGAGNPEATAQAVLRVLRGRGMMASTALR